MRPYIVFVALAVLLIAIVFALYEQLALPVPSYAVETILFFLILTAVLYRNIIQWSGGAPDIARFYLLSIVIKLVASLAYLVMIAWLDKQSVAGNALVFLGAYITFTACEILLLQRRRKN